MPSLVRSGRALLVIAGLWLALPAADAESLTIDRILAEPSINGDIADVAGLVAERRAARVPLD